MSRKNQANAQEPPPDARLVGYARVSTLDQSLAMQVDALLKAGVLPDNIHEEHVSGVAKKRPSLEAAFLDAVRGDTFVVWKLDRLGRSLIEIMMRVQELEARGVKIRSLTEGFDTTTPGGKAMMGFMAVMAQLERDLIQERTIAGMNRARQDGRTFGQPRKVDVEKAKALFRRGHTVKEVAKKFGCKVQAIYNYFDYDAVSRLIEEGKRERAARKTKRT